MMNSPASLKASSCEAAVYVPHCCDTKNSPMRSAVVSSTDARLTVGEACSCAPSSALAVYELESMRSSSRSGAITEPASNCSRCGTSAASSGSAQPAVMLGSHFAKRGRWVPHAISVRSLLLLCP